MATVGIRELKNQLSSYLGRVRGGETVVVTDRGAPVAQIIPMGVPSNLTKLMRDGRVTWGGGRFAPAMPKIRAKPGPLLSDYVGEDRG